MLHKHFLLVCALKKFSLTRSFVEAEVLNFEKDQLISFVLLLFIISCLRALHLTLSHKNFLLKVLSFYILHLNLGLFNFYVICEILGQEDF